MPEMSAGQRGAGGWVSGGVPGIEHDVPKPARPCGYFEGGGRCGVLSELRYVQGFRCVRHAPAVVAGRTEPTPDPARSVEGMRGNGRRFSDPSRYGAATTDPLGREGPGWHVGKQSGLPTKDKNAPA